MFDTHGKNLKSLSLSSHAKEHTMIPHPAAGIYFGRKYTNFKTLAEAKGFIEYLMQTYPDYDREPDVIYFEAFKASTRGIGPSIEEILAHSSSTPPRPEHFYQLGLVPHHSAAPKNDVPAPTPSGPVVTLADLTSDPSAARQALRKAHIDKPGSRWEWPKDHPDLPKVTKILTN